MKLLIPLFFALAQGSCYDYEYYDPTTGSSIPGNACARQAGTIAGTTAGAVVGTPVASQTFGASAAYTPIPATATTTAFGVPATAATLSYGTTAPAQVYTSAPIVPSAQISSFGTPIYGTSTIGASYTVAAPATVAAQYSVAAPYTVAGSYSVAAPVTTSVTTVAAPYTVAAPVATSVTTVRAPVVTAPVTVSSPYTVTTAVRAGAQGATTVRAGAQNSGNGNNPQLSAELQYYKDLGERQAAQRRRNARVVQDSAQDLSRASLFNTLIAGSGKTTPFFPVVRLGLQKDVADAYKSEKRIANRNADDAYQRFQEDPSRLNLLVSKYQDLNADLRDAAYQYNVVNSGTFGQRVANSGLFGGLSGGLFSGIGITQIITQRNQANDLQDIQRQMQRVQRQLAAEVQVQARANQNGAGAGAGATAGVQQGSVQQRMMAMSVYGPQRG